MSDTQSGENTNAQEADDITTRFPDPDQITTGRRSDIPEPPKATYTRQHLRRDTDPLPEGSNSILANAGRSSRNLRNMGVAGTIGISLAVSIGVGTGLGWLLDKYVIHPTTTPIGLIFGFLLGVFSGFANLIKVANQLNRDADQ
jgi:F0F1-type ATP synthase assembly protein I